MPLTPKQKSGIGIAAGVLLLGGGIAAIIIHNKNKNAQKTDAGTGGSGDGSSKITVADRFKQYPSAGGVENWVHLSNGASVKVLYTADMKPYILDPNNPSLQLMLVTIPDDFPKVVTNADGSQTLTYPNGTVVHKTKEQVVADAKTVVTGRGFNGKFA